MIVLKKACQHNGFNVTFAPQRLKLYVVFHTMDDQWPFIL